MNWPHAKRGGVRRRSMPSVLSFTQRPSPLPAHQLDTGANRQPHMLTRAISTLVGHSLLHALHSKHKSSASRTAGPVSPDRPSCPVSASRSVLARPRVLCCSSQVAWYDGHIVPPRFLRHSPTPAHNSTARVRPPSAEKSNVVGTSGVR